MEKEIQRAILIEEVVDLFTWGYLPEDIEDMGYSAEIVSEAMLSIGYSLDPTGDEEIDEDLYGGPH